MKKAALTRAWRAARAARSGISPRDVACQSGWACGRWGRGGGALREQRRTALEETSKRGEISKVHSEAARISEQRERFPGTYWLYQTGEVE